MIYNKNIPLLGICYGHQAIAHVLGGHVERFDNGWGAGVTTVNIIDQPDWLQPIAEKIDLLTMHQDQVTTMPPEAIRFLGSYFCHNSGFYIDDRVLAIQQHPEFTTELCRDLIVRRKKAHRKTIRACTSVTRNKTSRVICWTVDGQLY